MVRGSRVLFQTSVSSIAIGALGGAQERMSACKVSLVEVDKRNVNVATAHSLEVAEKCGLRVVDNAQELQQMAATKIMVDPPICVVQLHRGFSRHLHRR